MAVLLFYTEWVFFNWVFKMEMSFNPPVSRRSISKHFAIGSFFIDRDHDNRPRFFKTIKSFLSYYSRYGGDFFVPVDVYCVSSVRVVKGSGYIEGISLKHVGIMVSLVLS